MLGFHFGSIQLVYVDVGIGGGRTILRNASQVIMYDSLKFHALTSVDIKTFW
jgi:hypothetical protein